ncbi:DUF1906 domain-containing protein [Allokutzneria oryzae]|uniref:DUF1906 domain-containing protein n=1 Tax=Allokutzneria oryzae TaxID=1378989 RepID=A0ABV5ZSB1_9PSEU
MHHRHALLTGSVLATALLAPGTATADDTKTITYRGYQLDVPATWEVLDLDHAPHACVRFDRHVVYLGHPDDDQHCPSTAVGKTDALVLEPVENAKPTTAVVTRLPSYVARPTELPDTPDHEFAMVVSAAGVLVTASTGENNDQIRRILDTGRITPEAQVSTTDAVARPRAAAPRAVVPGIYRGAGFDTCTAPSSEAMRAWLGSPYRAIGIYIGGISRACSQRNLTADWVAEQIAQGWRLVPIYVGHQAPCTTYRNRIDPELSGAQGRGAADDAVVRATELGLAPGTTIYNDMESYDSSNVECREIVLTFLDNWTARVRELGFLSGVYSSVATGVRALANAYDSPLLPDHIWLARWDNIPTTSDRAIPDHLWANRQRIKQYTGGHDETYNGVTINIDCDHLDVGGP